MTILYALLWIASGIGAFLWLARGNTLTWGHLVAYTVFGGAFGPFIVAMVLFVAMTQAGFWDKPVFRRAGRSAD